MSLTAGLKMREFPTCRNKLEIVGDFRDITALLIFLGRMLQKAAISQNLTVTNRLVKTDIFAEIKYANEKVFG